MQDRCVLDSSVISAIFFLEKASSKVIQAVENRSLLTVDLAFAEVANVAWKRVTLFNENKDLMDTALKKSIEFINTSCEVIPTVELLDSSFKIAVREELTIYDSLFLAAAEIENVPLLTLDKKLDIGDAVELL